MVQNRLLCLLLLLVPVISFGFHKKTTHADKANAFLQSLDTAQRNKVTRPFYGTGGHEWAFIPAYSSNPAGIAYKDLNSEQQQNVNELLQHYLGDKGYQKTKSIMGLEPLLQVMEPNSPARIPGNYFIAVYGTPSRDSAWGWSFQGHHVVLNFTVVKDKVAFAPFFLGSNPGEVMEGAQKGLRILHEEEDLAYELMNAFSAQQKEKAIFQANAFPEIVTGAAIAVQPLTPAGIPAADFTNEQKLILHRLLVAYLSAMPDKLAAARFKKIQAEDMDTIYFGWAGSLTPHQPHYYRIQGKSFLVEFDNTQNNANHIHTVWRDFNGDFGRDLLKEHYQQQHH